MPTALVLAAPTPEPEEPASAYTVCNFLALLDPLQRGAAGAAANTTVQVTALISQPPWKDSAAGSGAVRCSMRAARALRHRRRAGLQLAAAAGSQSALRHETAAQTVHGASQNSPRSRGIGTNQRVESEAKIQPDKMRKSSSRLDCQRLRIGCLRACGRRVSGAPSLPPLSGHCSTWTGSALQCCLTSALLCRV